MDRERIFDVMETCEDRKQFELFASVLQREIELIRNRCFPKPKRVRKLKSPKWLWENDTTFSPQTIRCGTLLAEELLSQYGVWPTKVGKIDLIKKLRNFNGENGAFDPNRISLVEAKNFIEKYFLEWF